MVKNRKQFQSALIARYGSNSRRFPWREAPDPFKVIIAEVALKKTGAWKVEEIYNHLAERYGTPK